MDLESRLTQFFVAAHLLGVRPLAGSLELHDEQVPSLEKPVIGAPIDALNLHFPRHPSSRFGMLHDGLLDLVDLAEDHCPTPC